MVINPAPAPAPLEGEALLVFLQGWLTPICGLTGPFVRPAYQPEPSNVPTAGDAWMAFVIATRAADTFPWTGLRYKTEDDQTFNLQRNEELRILCSFYDLGTTGLADANASLLRDNLVIPENLEVLYSQGFALGYVEGLTQAPTILNSRWQCRIDLPVVVRRQIDRNYAVKNILTANGTVYTDVPDDAGDNYQFPITVTEE